MDLKNTDNAFIFGGGSIEVENKIKLTDQRTYLKKQEPP